MELSPLSNPDLCELKYVWRRADMTMQHDAENRTRMINLGYSFEKHARLESVLIHPADIRRNELQEILLPVKKFHDERAKKYGDEMAVLMKDLQAINSKVSLIFSGMQNTELELARKNASDTIHFYYSEVGPSLYMVQSIDFILSNPRLASRPPAIPYNI